MDYGAGDNEISMHYGAGQGEVKMHWHARAMHGSEPCGCVRQGMRGAHLWAAESCGGSCKDSGERAAHHRKCPRRQAPEVAHSHRTWPHAKILTRFPKPEQQPDTHNPTT